MLLLPPVHTELRLYDNHPDQARSEKGLDRGQSASKSSNLANRGLRYDVTTMPLRKTRC